MTPGLGSSPRPPGIYLFSAGAVFSSNSVGRRGLAIWIDHATGGLEIARRIVIPADGLTGTEATRILRLYEGRSGLR
jgi:hypothetical protein